jgi:hypothetical protein
LWLQRLRLRFEPTAAGRELDRRLAAIEAHYRGRRSLDAERAMERASHACRTLRTRDPCVFVAALEAQVAGVSDLAETSTERLRLAVATPSR